jgi:hypothetical protein
LNYRTLVALFLSVSTLSVHAEQRWFEVELLVFERNTDIQDLKEHLSSQEIEVNTENSISLLAPIKTNTCVQGEPCLSKRNPAVITGTVFDSQGNSFKRLDSSHLQLTKQREKLEEHASFNPVFHMAWRMPVKGPQASKPIHFFAGENLAFNIQKRQQALKNVNEPENLAKESTVTTDNPEVLNNDATEILMPAVLKDKWAIDGNFKVYLNHYLYIDSQLIIRKEVTEDVVMPEEVVELIDDKNGVQIAVQGEAIVDSTSVKNIVQQTVIKEILFDQNRRLRSEEVHYLDHPLMGIIVQIRKIPK